MPNEEQPLEETIPPQPQIVPPRSQMIASPRSWKDQLNWMWIIITTVIIILLSIVVTGSITIGAILQENIARRSATYQDLVNKVNEQNVKIDLLFEELRKTNSKLIEFKIPKVE